MAAFTPVRIPDRSPLVSKYLLITALIRKEMTIQFGRHELGFVWVFVDPILQVAVMAIAVGILRANSVSDIPFVFFLLLGVQLLNLFKSAMNDGLDAIGAHRQYMAYRTIGTLDVFFAKFLCQFMINMFSTVFFTIGAMWWGIEVSLGSLQIFTASYLGVWLMGCGSGLSLGVVTRNSPLAQKLLKLVNRPLMFLSCVLHPYAEVPVFYREYLYWNPLAHCIEWARKSLFPHYHVADLNMRYPWICVIVVMGIGTSIYFKNRHKL